MSILRFWVKGPRHSENIFAKKRYTSIVERAGLHYTPTGHNAVLVSQYNSLAVYSY